MTNLRQCFVAGSEEGKKGYCISFDYDQDVVENIKSMIPHTYREWREATKVWWVAEEYEDVLNKLFPNFYALAHLQGKLL